MPVTLPYTLTGGTPEDVAQLMANLVALRDAINAGAGDTADWTHDISPFPTPATTLNFATVAATGVLYGGYRSNAGVQNAEVGWDVVLGAGTWRVSLVHWKGSTGGICTVSLDGTSVGTIDGYQASSAYNNVSDISGITVSASGKKRLLLKMATKNASSSSYEASIQGVGLRRTA